MAQPCDKPVVTPRWLRSGVANAGYDPGVAIKPSVDPALVEIATELAAEAGEMTLQYFRSASLDVDLKGDGTPVTAADRAVERMIRERLASLYPDDAVVGEEHDDTVGTSGRTWIIDPIDGTQSFVSGVPLYATLVAVVDEHGPAVGVTNIPALGEIVAAGRGLGCTYNGRATQVSAESDLQSATVTCSGIDYMPAEATAALAASGASFRTWGDGYGYVLVATGRVAAMIDAPGLSIWDVAPMNVIIPEAGGTITSWSGEALPQGGSTIATNGKMHDELRAILAS